MKNRIRILADMNVRIVFAVITAIVVFDVYSWYTTVDTFIFKSTWDLNYHYITSNNTIIASNLESKSRLVRNPGLIGIQSRIKNINL